MRKLIIGDLHFGVKSNSLAWLQSQLSLFDKQIIGVIKDEEIDEVAILGDLMDIRFAVNQQVGIEVKNLIRRLLTAFPDKKFVMLAGNHDYYTPLEEFAYYNCYELMFGEEFLQCHPNLTIVSREPYLEDDGSLYLPWYWTENTDHFDEILYNYDFRNDVTAVYCHADLACWPGARIGSLRGCPVYSGHIHNIVEDPISNLYNVGAALALTFNDYNQDRYVYIIENQKIVKRVKNEVTFKFKRLFNEEIFTQDDSYFQNAYIQLCISSANLNKAKYIDQIKHIKSKYIDNVNIKVHVIDDDNDLGDIVIESLDTDIRSYIAHNIPSYLEDKYALVKSKVEKN